MQSKITNGVLSGDDILWETATNWVMQTREKPGDLDMERELARWLTESPKHIEIFREAETLWDLIGQVGPTLMPPSEIVDDAERVESHIPMLGWQGEHV